MSAVYAFANALEMLKQDTPEQFPNYYLMQSSNDPYGGDLFFQEYLSKARINGTKVFDKHGDFAYPKYAIYQYQNDSIMGIGNYFSIGDWFQGKLTFHKQKLKWASQNSKHGKEAPISSCSTECGPGYVLETSGGICCSGQCVPCKPYEYQYDAYTCKDCNEYGNDTLDWMPSFDRKGCQPPGHKILTPISMFLSMWGITITCIILYAFIQNIDTPIVKNSSKEHCTIILVGLLLLFLNAPIAEFPQNTATCGLLRYIAPLGFSMIYSALLIKLNRVHRIFQFKLETKKVKSNPKSKKPFHPSYVSVYSTLWITAGLIFIQLLISTILVLYDPPKSLPVYPDPHNPEVSIRKNDTLMECQYPTTTLTISHLYFWALMVACTYYAVQTRKLPENFNETKSIGFAMYSTCILWMLSIPTYFVARDHSDYDTRIHLYAITVSISGFIILACIFIPKAYIILCKPEKNKDEHVRISGYNFEQSSIKLNEEPVYDTPTERSGEQFICSKCKDKPPHQTKGSKITVSTSPSV